MPPLALTGIVTKAGVMHKTATVTVSRILVHSRTGKRLERSKKYLVHDENNQVLQGDTVIIRNCPPISARKRFALEKIVKSPETERLKLHQEMSRAAEAAERAEAAESPVSQA
ncbi:nucleic acid-binding protein [Obba rivulosa]|uniref:Nucleic acid-binding protein n=1 Tax=Obba rivulosa TaxID=1052685 RepID=A0A8E2AQM2_9APHY|nr:nucleic acid-binding protein [Obba rivulosa]